jgi:hypothetical protein
VRNITLQLFEILSQDAQQPTALMEFGERRDGEGYIDVLLTGVGGIARICPLQGCTVQKEIVWSAVKTAREFLYSLIGRIR